MTDLLLWFDTETAGPSLPDAAKDTVLEVAWTITRRYPSPDMRWRRDLDDWQLTPLRSRFTTLSPAKPDGLREHRRPTSGGYGHVQWPERTGDVQKRMHAASGLDVEHMGVSRDLIIGHGGELSRLVLDDLYRAVRAVGGRLPHGASPADADTEPVTLYLAGDGIGHYDRGLMNRECPRVSAHLHYRPVDISVAVQALSDVEESPTRALMALDDVVRRDFVSVLSHLDVDPEANAVAGGLGSWLDVETVDPHRAAPDVARAMLAYLVGRWRVGTALSAERPY